MKKVIPFCSLILIIFLLVGCSKNKDPFLLEEKYYENSEFIELSNTELDDLTTNKESFAVFIYQPMCNTAEIFEKLLQEFMITEQISFYKIAFKDIKDLELGKCVKYYPSFVIYNNGEIVDYLDANSNEDINRYKNIEDFKNWFTKYVKLEKQ